MSFTPKTRLEKILCGVSVEAKSRLEKAVKAAMERVASALELPIVTADDNGDLLGVSGGKWKKVAPPTIQQLTFECTGTQGEDASHNETMTLNKTAAELFEAVQSGKTVIVNVTVETGGGAQITVKSVFSVAAVCMTSGDTNVYGFRFVSNDGGAFSVENLMGTDTVVLTEEAAT